MSSKSSPRVDRKRGSRDGEIPSISVLAADKSRRPTLRSKGSKTRMESSGRSGSLLSQKSKQSSSSSRGRSPAPLGRTASEIVESRSELGSSSSSAGSLSPKSARRNNPPGTGSGRSSREHSLRKKLEWAMTATGNWKVSVYEAASHSDENVLAPLLRQFIARGKSIDSVGGRNRATMLHEAAFNNNLNTLRYIIKQGAKLDSRDYAGATPLQMAATSGAVACIEALLEAGADLETADDQGTRPLHSATIKGHLDSVKKLVRAGANVNACDEFYATPLHYAALHGHRDVLEYLLRQKHAKVDAKDEEGLTPLHLCMEGGYDGCVKVLLKGGADPNSRNEQGMTPLQYACEKGRYEAVLILLDQGARINVSDTEGSTPLHSACFNGHIELVELLVSGGAIIDDGTDSDSPLHHAAFNGHLDCVQFLIKSGANVNHLDASGAASLHKACFGGHAEVAHSLVEAGADPRRADNDGATALHRCAQSGSLPCLQLLLKHNVDVAARDTAGASALHVAAFFGHAELIGTLVKAGIALDARDEAGNSALHLALDQKHLHCVEELLKFGADHEALNSKDMAPLHFAVADADCLQALLRHEPRATPSSSVSSPTSGDTLTPPPSVDGVLLSPRVQCSLQIDRRDRKGRTPLFYAVRAGVEASVRALILRGADLYAVDDKGVDPLHASSAMRKRFLLRLLQERDDKSKGERQRMYRRIVPTFNEKPKKGIALGIAEGILENTPESIATFVSEAEDLNKKSLGEYLADKDDQCSAVRKIFTNAMDVSKMRIDEALRLFLARFRLPGEAQQIDRLMEAFADRYHECNPGQFADPDTSYILAMALIMLQTDAHNPTIKEANKMTLEQFVRNLRGVNKGGDLPPDLLTALYGSVVEQPLAVDSATSMYAAASRKGWLTKQGGRIKTWKARWFVLSENVLYYFKDDKSSEPQGIVPLENIIVMATNKRPNCFELLPADSAHKMKAAKLSGSGMGYTHHDRFVLAAESQEDMVAWIEALESGICRNPFRDLIRRHVAAIELGVPLNGDPTSVDFRELHQLALLCRYSTTRSESQLRKKFGHGTVFIESGVFRGLFVNCNSNVIIGADSGVTEKPRQRIAIGVPDFEPFRRLSELWRKDVTDPEELRVKVSRRLLIEDAVNDMCDRILPILDKTIFTRIVAHSAGALIACALAQRLKNSGALVDQVVTLGAPRFLPRIGVLQYGGLPLLRVRVVDDPVPLELLPGMRHVGSLVLLLKGLHYSYALDPNTDREELAAVEPDRFQFSAPSHHIDEYIEELRMRVSRSLAVDYRSPERIKHSK